MQTDNKVLLDNVEQAFALAVHPDISREQQKQFESKGFELRARLMTLLTAIFDEGTQAVLDANKQIGDVNKRLKNTLNDINSAASTIAALSQLVSTLDSLFKLPFSFK